MGISVHPNSSTNTSASAGSATLTTARLDALTRANRDMLRVVAPSTSPSTLTPASIAPATPATTATTPPAAAAAPATPATPAAPAKPATPAPLPRVAGYTAAQISNAWAIVQEGHRMGVNQRGQQIAIATAMQESNLHNYTYAVDHDSLGLFQQRPSCGWGTPKQLTNPTYAAHAFYAVLLQHKSTWGVLWQAAQTVQGSAFPYAYQKHASAALALVKILDARF